MDLTNLMAGIDELNIDSRYRLVIITAQRGRQLMQGSPPLVRRRFSKDITVALDEALQEKIEYVIGDEARAALKDARLKEGALKPKVLPGVEEIKKDLPKNVDNSKGKEVSPLAVEKKT